jgi:heptosyltransferase III
VKLRGNPWLKAVDRYLLGAFLALGRRIKDKTIIQQAPRSILLIKFNALGDTILFVSLAKILKRRFPGVRIDFLGSEINRPVLERCPDLDHILIIQLEQMVDQPWAFLMLLDRLRQRKYDVVIDGSQWERITALISVLSGAHKTIGFDTPGQKRATAYNYRIKHRRELHEIDCFFALLEPLGIIPEALERYTSFEVNEVDRQQLNQLALPEGRLILFHPGCGAHGFPRQWPMDRYIELGNRMMVKHPDITLVLSGSASEAQFCQEIEEGVKGRVINLSTKLNFLMLAALLKRSDLLVCGNTGVMHLAAAMNVPTVALHGPTDPRRWGPLSNSAVVVQSTKACAPCLYLGDEYNCECPDCMNYIEVDDVYRICEEILITPVKPRESVGGQPIER